MEFSAENQHFELKNQNQEFEFNPEQTFIEIENPINAELILENTHAEIELDGKSEEKISENDHTKLINRDVADQHPISAISGLQEALDNIKLPNDIVTDKELNEVKEEFSKALEDKANQVDFEQAVSDFGEALDGKQPKGNYALKSEIPNTSNFATKQELEQGLEEKQPKGNYALKSDLENIESETSWGEITGNISNQSDLQTALKNKTDNTVFQSTVNEFGTIINNLQPKGDYALKSDLENVSVKVSEKDNLYQDEDILKVFTEAGNSAITSRFARLLNLAQKSDWKSLITDTGVLILYSGSISYRTTNGIDFQQVYLPASPSDMGKNYETQTIYCPVASSAGMWMYSTDDGLTWTYNTEKSLGSLAWNKVCVKNNGSQKIGWNSSMCFVRTNGSTTQNFANFSVSSNKFELNNNSKKRIDYVTGLDYDYWCANIQGEVFKTAGSSTFTIYENTKYGLTHIENCNGTIFCGFQDGTIAECMGYKKEWIYYTVASGERVTDIKYRDGVFYVVTNASNFYTSTDKVNWTKTAVLNSYGGKLEFARFGIVQVTDKPVLLPSRQRLEDLLLYLTDRTDFAKICGAGLKFENGQIQVDVNRDIPIRISQGRLNLFNIDKMYFSEEVIIALIASRFAIDYCPADDYDSWLWGSAETGYWDGETWANRSVLWIFTGSGYVYDPLGYTWEMEVAQFDVIRLIYDEWGSGTTAEKVGSLAQLKVLFNS